METGVLSLVEAADSLGIPENHLIDAIERGWLPALDGNGQWFILSTDLAWLRLEEVRA
jgi:hypothetical protein